MWLPIKLENPNQANKAMKFAGNTVQRTHDRMKYGSGVSGIKKRRSKIYVGKIAEQIVHRYLRGELKLDISEDEHRGGPDRFDFRIELQNRQITGDVKGFHIFQKYRDQVRTPKDVEEKGLALVPTDQFDDGKPKDLYIFAMLLANSDLSVGTCFMRWATRADIDPWRFIPEGTPIYPYDKTRNPNYGQEISQCRPMEDFIDYLNLPPF